jgi:hypothetical protein
VALTDDIGSHYKLEEGAGAAILDYFSDYDLSVTGTVNSTTGKVGNARTFVASGSSRGDAGARSSVTAIPATLTCWFRLNSTGVAHALMSCCTAAANTLIILGVNSSNQLVGYGESAGVGSVPLAGTTTLTTGTWYHAAFVAESGAFKIYLDGSVEDTDTTALSISGFDRQYLAARFYGGGLGEYADADIDEATFFARALDAADISTLRSGGAGLDFSAWDTGLDDAAPYAVAHWPFDEANGTRADSVGSADLTDNNTVGSGTGLVDGCASFVAASSEWLYAALTPPSGGTWALCFYIKTTAAGDFGILSWDNSSSGTSGVHERELYHSGVSTLNFYVHDGTTAHTISATRPINDGEWHSVIAQLNSGVMQLIIDGIPQDDTEASATGYNSYTTPHLIVGRAAEASASPFGTFEMDELVLLDGYALTQYQAVLHRNGGAGVAFADWPAAPAAAWPIVHRLLANPNAGSTWRLAPA